MNVPSTIRRLTADNVVRARDARKPGLTDSMKDSRKKSRSKAAGSRRVRAVAAASVAPAAAAPATSCIPPLAVPAAVPAAAAPAPAAGRIAWPRGSRHLVHDPGSGGGARPSARAGRAARTVRDRRRQRRAGRYRRRAAHRRVRARLPREGRRRTSGPAARPRSKRPSNYSASARCWNTRHDARPHAIPRNLLRREFRSARLDGGGAVEAFRR